MTILEALTTIDSIKPNNYTPADKIRWLSELDGIVKAEIIDTHEGGENIAFEGYDENTDQEIVLLVPAPYEDIYIKWLESKIDYTNAEYGKYNNSSTAYNTVYTAFEKYYNRHNMPIQTKMKFF